MLPLKIGLIIDILEPWHYEFITNLLSVKDLEIKHIYSIPKKNGGNKGIASIFDFLIQLIYRIEEKLCSGLNSSKKIQFENSYLLELLKNKKLWPKDYLLADDLPDLIISLSKENDYSFLNFFPLHGIWHYETSLITNKNFAGYWELLTNQGEIQGELLISNKSGNFSTSQTSSYLHKTSVYKSLLNHNSKISGHFLNELVRYISSGKVIKKTNSSRQKTTLSSIKYILLLLKLPFHYLKIICDYAVRIFYKKKWFILFKEIKGLNEIFNLDLNSLIRLKTNKIERADPFIYDINQSKFLFFEEINAKGKGHLAYSSFNSNTCQLSKSESILNLEFHLSFPNIFSVGKDYYMIPESEAGKKIMLYKCIDFPGNWQFVRNLIENVCATDTVVLYYNNLWWLFTSIKNKNMTYNYDDLYLYYSESLEGNWIAHPLNPVVSDVKTARCAGKIIVDGTKLYRPSQNCKFRYGYGININEIVKLSTNNYEERIIKSYLPDKTNFSNIHTLNISSNCLFMDAK